jgi:hypothetical protein
MNETSLQLLVVAGTVTVPGFGMMLTAGRTL